MRVQTTSVLLCQTLDVYYCFELAHVVCTHHLKSGHTDFEKILSQKLTNTCFLKEKNEVMSLNTT